MIKQRNVGKIGVKGTWLVDWAKMVNLLVKRDPSKKTVFDKYLTVEDWLQLKALIIPSVVYPYNFSDAWVGRFFIL